MNKKFYVYFIVMFSLFFVSCKRDKESLGIIKVGVILPLSGEVASYGSDCKDGILFAKALDSLNIEYVFEDSKGDPKTAIAAYNKLTTVDKVEYVIGDMFSNTTLSLSPLAKKQQKLLVSPTASSKDISKDNIYALSVFPCESYESKLVADFAKKQYSKIGVLYEKVAAAQAMRDAYVSEFEQGQIVFDEAFESTINSFRDIIYKIRGSRCESIYLISYTNNAIKLMTQMKEIGFSVDLIGQSALYDPSMIEHLSDYQAAFFLTGPLFNITNKDKMSKAFVEGYMRLFNKEPNQMSSQGYVAAIIAHDLFRYIKSNVYSKECIINYRNSFFGSEFKFDEDLTSMSGLRMYKFDNKGFYPITE